VTRAMAAHSYHGGTVAGTAGGTLLTIFANIHSEDIVKTAVLASIGAVVSFTVSLMMKWISHRIVRRSGK
jgi:mannitol-specific phosphotransferase system IIBC component